MIEEWRSIEAYSNYEVSSTGIVRSLDHVTQTARGLRAYKGMILTPPIDNSGYKYVNLSNNGKQHPHRIHVLVATAFLLKSSPELEVCHIDGDSLNNIVSNLRWGTRSSNSYDRVKHGSHWEANKKKCPRGHSLLLERNLIPSALNKRNRRECLSCSRARNWLKRHEGSLQSVSDRYYIDLQTDL